MILYMFILLLLLLLYEASNLVYSDIEAFIDSDDEADDDDPTG